MPRAALVPGLLVLLAVVGVACGDDGSGDAAFCDRLAAAQGAIVSPTLADGDDVDRIVSLYRDLADAAPLDIEDEWAVLARNVETAATVVPGDDESVQRAVAQAYASEGAAVDVAEWARQRCGIDLGPVTTIAPQGPLPTTTLATDVGGLTEEPAG